MPPVPKEVPNTRFIDLVTNPAQVTYSRLGEGLVDLGPNRYIKVTGYRKVSVRLGSTQATELVVVLGKISGETLSTWHRLPIEQRTYTFDITGPELGIWLFGGPANATESVDCWVYLTS